MACVVTLANRPLLYQMSFAPGVCRSLNRLLTFTGPLPII